MVSEDENCDCILCRVCAVVMFLCIDRRTMVLLRGKMGLGIEDYD